MHWTLEEDSSFLPRGSDPQTTESHPYLKGISLREDTVLRAQLPVYPLLAAESLSQKKEPKGTQSGSLYIAELQLLLTFSKTKRERIGSRKPKQELRAMMTQAMRPTLGKVTSFQKECSPRSDSWG